MGLTGTVENVLAAAEKLKSSGGNEANTKALLIEPLLAALGWDTADIDHVEREFRVYDGTSLDYALKVDGEPRLFLEAKSLTKSLEDKTFISQTVNYANNEGVVWCVLTNGLSYRIYKTNEPVAMDEKLLFEIDLAEASDGAASDVAGALQLISRKSIAEGQLETWGERVFVDKRVRDALVGLATKPPPDLIRLVRGVIGKPAVPAERIQESLARILDVDQSSVSPPPKGPVKASLTDAKSTKAAGTFTLEHHLAGKPAAIVDLFEQVDEFGRNLGTDVSRRIRKFYVGYFRGKRSFFTVEVQRRRLIVYLNLDPTQASPWDEQAMRDVRNIGHYGMGDTELSLRQGSQLELVKDLIKQAYLTTA